MKYFLIILIFSSRNSYAVDCEKIIQEMETFNSKIQSTLSSATRAEQDSLNNIFNKQVRGPRVLQIAKENEDKLFKVILPSRKKADDAIVSGLSNYIAQLKICQKKINDCTGAIKNNPRNNIKDLSETIDQANDQITSKSVPK